MLNKIITNDYSLWRYEVSDRLKKDKRLEKFLKVIDCYKIELLKDGQQYHDKEKRFISITIKPIKTTFIIPYHKNDGKVLLFPAYEGNLKH